MDVRIEAAPMTARAEVLLTVIRVTKNVNRQALALVEQVASFSRLFLGSIAANAPNISFEGSQAVAVI